VGEVVAPGAPLVTLADLDHPFVDVFVPQSEIAALRIGMPMSVRVDSLSRPLSGTVERIGTKTEFTPRFLFSDKERENLVIRVRVRVEDPKHLLTAGVPAFVTPRTGER
jgi:HlyD family secretion protein